MSIYGKKIDHFSVKGQNKHLGMAFTAITFDIRCLSLQSLRFLRFLKIFLTWSVSSAKVHEPHTSVQW